MGKEFNECLKKLRKEKGMTQEELAEAVGVSAQAVSKWELGSLPDAGLLPAVADALGTTIDTLFGRGQESPSLEQLLSEELDRAERDEDGKILCSVEGEKRRMQCAWRICHLLACVYARCSNSREVSEMTIEGGQMHDMYTQVSDEGGFFQAKLNRPLQYFLLMPQPEYTCKDPAAPLCDPGFEELFCFLGRPKVLRALEFLAEQRRNMFIDSDTLIEELAIGKSDAEEIIAGLLKFQFISRAELKRGKENAAIYKYCMDCNLVSFLTFAYVLLKQPRNFNIGICNRSRPYFKSGAEENSEKD